VTRARTAAAVACAALAAPAAGASSPVSVLLPSTRTGLTETPPLLARTRLPEQRFPGSISSRERIVVGVGETGAVRSVRVVQRLVVRGLGDYVFAVGAPAVEVRPVPGSRSDPGFRRGAIVWQGFSPGRRELAADARLRVRDAAGALPLRVSIESGTLTLENATAVRARTFGGSAPAGDVAAALRAVRRAAATGTVAGDLLIHSARIRQQLVTVDTALRIEGEFADRRVSVVLGGGNPRRIVVPGDPSARPRLRLTVRPFFADEPGRPTLLRAAVASLRLARLRQFESFLVNPDPLGAVAAVYEYRLEPARAAPPPAPAESGWSTAAVIAAVGAALAGSVGLLALWARS
jgi:hypothetical protein